MMRSLTALLALASASALSAQSPPASRNTQGPPDSLRVPILVYHNIQSAAEAGNVRAADLTMRPEVFTAQMQYLKDNGIAVISLGALVDALEGKGRVPARAVVITFDDGRVNQLTNAVPVLRKHGFPATFFPFTHAMDRNPRYFTWEQLRELERQGMTVGSHTNLHVRVDRVRDPKEMDKEVRGSREAIRKNLGSEGAFFAYPWGAMSPTADSAVRAAGFRAARVYDGKTWNSRATLMRLHAVPMTENMKRFQEIVNPPAASSSR